MKDFKIIILVMLFCGFYSCTPDQEETPAPIVKTQKGKLSLGSVLQDLNKTQILGIPKCSGATPQYVRVAIKNVANNTWVAGHDGVSSFIEIAVNPNGSDTNNDGKLDSWFTKESLDLELEPGKYSIEYFAVLDGNGQDAEIIFLAPRKDADYGAISFQNYVSKPLPFEVEIFGGEKHYEPIEVLCYDEIFAASFGYLFFDFSTPGFTYLCIFGNVCDEIGLHSPANFRLKVWNFSDSGDYTEHNLITDQINGTGTLPNGDSYADPICIPLKNSDGNEEFYGEIFTIDDGGIETLIRAGKFSAALVNQNLFNDKPYSIYHFREDCCDELEDSYPLLEDLSIPECDEPCQPCEGQVNSLQFQYKGTNDVTVQIIQDNNSEILFEDNVSTSDFIEIHAPAGQSFGPKIIIKVNGEDYATVHTSCSEPIGPGLIFGNFEITSGSSKTGGELCPVIIEEECQPCEGQVNSLQFQYKGANDVSVKIIQDNNSMILFENSVSANDFIEIHAPAGQSFGPKINIKVDGDYYASVHTSCSEPIGPGLTFGDFEITSGSSKTGGELCPVIIEEDCSPCAGKITELTLEYLGTGPINISVIQNKDSQTIYSNPALNANTAFTFNGTYNKSGKTTMWTEITIKIDGITHTQIHTSCSQDIGPGMRFGDFRVIAGRSLHGGILCTP
ncbi:hypothetical protein [Christiangramia aquimixticola]|uniref:DUF7467 domain-containing protein n=1 Tax=Christiangramia aquimixticola TaxID=1697558 RepID=UPI003AA92B33